MNKTIHYVTSRRTLLALKKDAGLRDDWHEPDEQDVKAKCVGSKFDNAGFGTEKHIVLTHNGCDYAVNLATLLAWATGYRDKDDDPHSCENCGWQFADLSPGHNAEQCRIDNPPGDA